MPQAVSEYISFRDFDRMDAVKRDILTLYREDIAKYAEGYVQKVNGIFDEIPAQLQKHEKKFRLSAIKKDARFRDYEDAFFWLDDAMRHRISSGLYDSAVVSGLYWGLVVNRMRPESEYNCIKEIFVP